MARNLFARLFRRNEGAKQTAVASSPPLVSAPAPEPAITPPAATTPVMASAMSGNVSATTSVPVAANAVTVRQCVSCGRDLAASQTVCPSCGLAVQATATT